MTTATATGTATRSSSQIQKEIDELTPQIPARRERMRVIEAERNTRRGEVRSADAAAVRAGKGETAPAADQSAADLARLERAVGAQEQALLEDEEHLGALQREHGLARGREHVELERTLMADSYAVRERLLQACMEVLIARNEEYALDSGLHQTRVELDRIHAATSEPTFSRGVFGFQGAVRPLLNGIGNQIEQLCRELDVSIDGTGRITRRGPTLVDGTVRGEQNG